MHFRFLIAGCARMILECRDIARICAFVYFSGVREAADNQTGENQ
jgi:hypothetical protein